MVPPSIAIIHSRLLFVQLSLRTSEYATDTSRTLPSVDAAIVLAQA